MVGKTILTLAAVLSGAPCSTPDGCLGWSSISVADGLRVAVADPTLAPRSRNGLRVMSDTFAEQARHHKDV